MNTINGAWSVVSLPGDANPLAGDLPNEWYVSCAENGHTNTVCGTGCVALSAINTLASLHVGSTSAGDIGAAYDAGGLCGFLWCTNTHKRAQSPLISTIGKVSITVAFDYIEFGQTTIDDMYAFQYSINGGVSWVTISNPPKTVCCGGACNGTRQGKWTTLTSAILPVACENIANFRLAFVWQNNDDGLGTDPSYAMDNLTLSTPVVLPIELIDFTSNSDINSTNLLWKTASEKNSSYYEIQKSEDGFSFFTIGKVQASGNSNKLENYFFKDTENNASLVYYRLKMVDNDNSFQFSKLLAIEANSDVKAANNYFVNESRQLELDRNFVLINNAQTLSIINVEGKVLADYSLPSSLPEDKIIIPCGNLSQGIYLGLLRGSSTQKSFKFFIPN